MTVENLVLTVDEVAKLLRISRASAYEGVKTGAIPSVRVNRRILIPAAQIARMLEGNGSNSTPGAN